MFDANFIKRMKISHKLRESIALAVACGGAAELSADLVETTGGTRTVLKIDDGSVVVDTTCAGTVTIEQNSMTAITTTGDAGAVLLASGTRPTPCFNQRIGRLFWMNDSGRREMGIQSVRDAEKTNWMHLCLDDGRAEAQGAIESAAVRGGDRFTGSCRTPEGAARWWDASVVPISDDICAPGQFLCISRDITERKQSEWTARQLAQFIELAFEAVIVIDNNERITFWNRGAERVLGWSSDEAHGRSFMELPGPDGARLAEFTLSAASADEPGGEFCVEAKAGGRVYLELHAAAVRDKDGRPTAHVCVASDVTETKRLEEHLLRSQRLEGIGLLAAGVAHDLNNTLSPVLMAVPLLRQSFPASVDMEVIEMLENNTKRCSALVRQLLAFVRGTNGERLTLHARHLLRNIISLVRQTFPRSIHLETAITPDLPAITANPTQIQQILLNLCVNSRDAMPDGGTLRIGVSTYLLVDAAALPHQDA